MRLLSVNEWPSEISDMLEKLDQVFSFTEDGERKLMIVSGFGVQEWIYINEDDYTGYSPANWWLPTFNEGEEWKSV